MTTKDRRPPAPGHLQHKPRHRANVDVVLTPHPLTFRPKHCARRYRLHEQPVDRPWTPIQGFYR